MPAPCTRQCYGRDSSAACASPPDDFSLYWSLSHAWHVGSGTRQSILYGRLWDILISERTTMSKAHTQLEKGLLSSQHPGLFCPTPHKGTTSALRARGP